MKCKLGDYIRIKHGFAFKGEYITAENNGVVLVTPGNFEIGGGFKEDKCKFFNGDYPKEYVLSPYDLIVTMTDLSKQGDTLGYSALVPKTNRVYLHNQRIGLVDVYNPKADKMFIYWLMRTQKYQKTIVATSSGSTVKHTSPSRIYDVEVDLPPIDVQKKIAAILSALDKKIATNRAINDNLEQHAKALVRQYCKKITSSVELGTILSFENGFAFQSSSYHEKGKYRIITIKNVQDGRIDSQGASCIDDIPLRMKKGCILSIGDVLLSLTGNVGRVGIVCEDNLLLNQRVAKFVPNDIRILPLLYFYFRLPSTKTSLETISKGTAQQNLSPIETLKLEIPYEALQALELSNLLQPMFNTIYQKSIENIQLAEIRDSLLPRLMSGELDVSAVKL